MGAWPNVKYLTYISMITWLVQVFRDSNVTTCMYFKTLQLAFGLFAFRLFAVSLWSTVQGQGGLLSWTACSAQLEFMSNCIQYHLF